MDFFEYAKVLCSSENKVLLLKVISIICILLPHYSATVKRDTVDYLTHLIFNSLQIGFLTKLNLMGNSCLDGMLVVCSCEMSVVVNRQDSVEFEADLDLMFALQVSCLLGSQP